MDGFWHAQIADKTSLLGVSTRVFVEDISTVIISLRVMFQVMSGLRTKRQVKEATPFFFFLELGSLLFDLWQLWF